MDSLIQERRAMTLTAKDATDGPGILKLIGNTPLIEITRIDTGKCRLFVKLENLASVQKYSGKEGFQPPLSKIGGKEWREIKRKTKESLSFHSL